MAGFYFEQNLISDTFITLPFENSVLKSTLLLNLHIDKVAYASWYNLARLKRILQ